MQKAIKLSLILLCLVGGTATAQDSDWRLEKDKKGIQIYTRAVEGSDFRAIRGITRIEGRLSSIVALLQDMSYWPKLNKIIASAQIHEQQTDTESLVYMQMDMPWPVSDRDVLNQRRVTQNKETKVVELAEVATTDILPSDEDYVRIVQSTQKWTLSPNEDGSVDVVWYTHTDPNGPIPATIVNMLSVGAPYESLTILRKAIQDGKYRDAKLSYICEL